MHQNDPNRRLSRGSSAVLLASTLGLSAQAQHPQEPDAQVRIPADQEDFALFTTPGAAWQSGGCLSPIMP